MCRSIDQILHHTFTQWGMAPDDLSDYGLRFGPTPDSQNKYVQEGTDEEGVTRISVTQEDLAAAQNIFILDYSPRRIARDKLDALNAKTDCEEKAAALLEVTRRHPDSFLEPLVAQGALAKTVQFLERQMEDLNSEKNQKAIVKIMDFIGK